MALATGADFALFAVKLYLGLSTASLCIYSDAINNLFDTLGCLLAVFGVWLAMRPGSRKYPDGMGKAEDLTGFIMAVCVAFTGFYFAYLALDRFMYPRPVNFLVRHAVLLGVTILVKLILGVVFFRLYKKRNSLVLKTVYTDSFADCGVTAMTLLSFILSATSGLRADAVFGLVLSAVIIVNGVKLVLSSAKALLGENDAALNEKIEAAAKECGFQTAGAKTYKTGKTLTLALTVSGDGDENEAREKISKLTGADLFIKRR